MSQNITISFLLPSLGDKPGGGYRIVLEYANRLAQRGVNVNVVYPLRVSNRGIIKNVIGVVHRFFRLVTFNYSATKWFHLSSNVHEKVVWALSDRYLPKSDLYVATAVRTAMELQRCSFSIKQKIYFIQGYENWSCSEQQLEKTYRYGMTNIVVSRWLKQHLDQNNIPAYLVRNAFDFNYFKLTMPIKERDKWHISMQYSDNPIKGSQYAIQAITMLKQKYPLLKVTMFGIMERPHIDKWISYYQKPDRDTHNYIYNTSSIFIAPSLSEGWGLTVGEAMICGNAVVCSENLGHLEMASDMETALLCPIKDAMAIYDKVEKLIKDDSLRWRIAKNASSHISQFVWDKSVDDFYNIIVSTNAQL